MTAALENNFDALVEIVEGRFPPAKGLRWAVHTSRDRLDGAIEVLARRECDSQVDREFVPFHRWLGEPVRNMEMLGDALIDAMLRIAERLCITENPRYKRLAWYHRH